LPGCLALLQSRRDEVEVSWSEQALLAPPGRRHETCPWRRAAATGLERCRAILDHLHGCWSQGPEGNGPSPVSGFCRLPGAWQASCSLDHSWRTITSRYYMWQQQLLTFKERKRQGNEWKHEDGARPCSCAGATPAQPH
jgi:hypothetical protein